MFPVSVLTALLPAFTQGLQQVFTRFFGSAQPATVDERIRLMQAESQAAQSLATLDTVSGTPSQWVVDLRSALRPIASLVLVIGFVAAVVIIAMFQIKLDSAIMMILGTLGDLAGAAIFYWFGERFHFNLSDAAARGRK